MDQRSVTVQCTHSRRLIGLLHSDRYRPTEQGWKKPTFFGIYFRFLGFLGFGVVKDVSFLRF